jgi:multiple sugar transport system substrate-binding protein
MWPAQAQTIELWSFLDPNGKGVRSELLQKILKDFEAKNSGVTVKTNVIQWTELGPQLLRAARAGNVPDVVMLYSPFMQPQIGAGSLMPLDDLVKNWSEDDRKDTITLPIARDRKGQLFGIPWELRAYGLVYRSDLIQKAPTTWEEMIVALQKAQADGRQGMAASFSATTSTAPIEWLMPTVISLGGKILKEDGSAAFQGPETERVLQLFHDLAHKHKLMPVETTLLQSDDAQNLAIAGKAAAHAQGSHRLTTIQERSPAGAQWTFAAFPAVEKGQPTPLSIQGWNLAIPRRAKNPQLAWKLIEHWISKEVQLEQAVKAGYLPMRRSVAKDPSFATEQNMRFGLPALLDYAAANPLDFNWPENTDALNDALGRMVQEVLTNRMSPKEATVLGEKTYNENRR